MASIVRANVTFTPYQEAKATAAMRGAPRFGHSSNFALLFSSNDDDKSDYMRGLLFIAGFSFGLFLVWGIALLVLKFARRKRQQQGGNWINRGFFFSAGILCIVFTMLLVLLGFEELRETLDTMDESNSQVGSLTLDADDIIAGLLDAANRGKQARDALSKSLANLCANATGQEAIPINSTVHLEEFGINTTTNGTFVLDANVVTTMRDAVNSTNGLLADFAIQTLKDVQDGIESVYNLTEDVNNTLEDIDSNRWPSILVLILYITFTLLLMVAATLTWVGSTNKWLLCIANWGILPIFVLLIIAAIIISCVLSIPVVANADFCSGGNNQIPDVTVRDYLVANGWDPNSLKYQLVEFYIRQCLFDVTSPYADIEVLSDSLNTAKSVTSRFADILGGVDPDISIALLERVCNQNLTQNEASVLADGLVVIMQEVSDSIIQTLEVIACNRIVPIYVNTFYQGTCTNSVTGFTWTFGGFLIVAFMGMIMITTRSALYPPGDEDFGDAAAAMASNDGLQSSPQEEDGIERVYIDDPTPKEEAATNDNGGTTSSSPAWSSVQVSKEMPMATTGVSNEMMDREMS